MQNIIRKTLNSIPKSYKSNLITRPSNFTEPMNLPHVNEDFWEATRLHNEDETEIRKST
jgi:hypothetical protein